MTRRLSLDEATLWRDVTRGITPMQTEIDTALVVQDTPLDTVRTEVKSACTANARTRTKPIFLPVSRENPAQDVDARTLGRFRRGQMAIERTLDLHGHGLRDAEYALGGFLKTAQISGARCVLIIHGRGSMTGEAKIKSALPLWLEQWPDVILAHHAAKPKHGGAGASYVLLRRKR